MKAKKVLVAAVAASLTLGCVAGFAGCASKSETGDFKELSMTDAYETKATKSYAYSAAKVSDLDGYTYDSGSNSVLIFSKTDSENATTTYKYYDLINGITSLTVTNTSTVTNDVQQVTCTVDSRTIVCGYVVTKETIPTSGTTTYSYTVYGANGTSLATTDKYDTNYSGDFTISKNGVKSFGLEDKYFAYDSKTKSLVATTEPDKFAKYNTADDMTEVVGDYGYVQVNNTLSVYKIENSVVTEKYADYELPESDYVDWWVLANGNVLVQTIDYLSTSSTDYDMYYSYYSDSVNANYEHYVYNFEKKKASKVTMNYFVNNVYANTEDGTYEELYNDEIENVVMAYKIVDGQYNPSDDTTKMVLSVTNEGKTKGELPLSSKDNGMFTSLGGSYYKDNSGYRYEYKDEELKEKGYVSSSSYGYYYNDKYMIIDDVVYDYSSLAEVKKFTDEEHVYMMTVDGVLYYNDDGEYYYLNDDGQPSKIADSYGEISSLAADGTKTVLTNRGNSAYVLETITKSGNTTTIKYELKDYEGNVLMTVNSGAVGDNIRVTYTTSEITGYTMLVTATQTDTSTSKTTTTYYRLAVKAE